ncbi:MAG: transcriptional regulator [Microbacterium sp.]|uniref:ArsR/SmtB family transcription factor n=1 Tax=Microbacterium sp. TaxID=51671 RepID=UPI000DB1BB18|nr:metalloregulator ArsR/SmtB family transcription factor [Microbacterium sp.]PZU41721.1 MAG: transcriptional regulator [Microbacterium sp.]
MVTMLEVTDVTPGVVCCAPLVREPLGQADAEQLAVTLKALAEPLGQADAEQLAVTLKALADPARLRLLSIVASSEDQEACVCDLIDPIGLSQPTVSHHLKVLTEAGFLSRSKRGTWAYYRLLPDALEQVSGLLVTA